LSAQILDGRPSAAVSFSSLHALLGHDVYSAACMGTALRGRPRERKPASGDAGEGLLKWLAERTSAALRERFEQEKPWLTIAANVDGHDGLGGPPLSDPLTLDLLLSLQTDGEFCYFRCTLEDLIDELINDYVNPITKKVEAEDGQSICIAAAARLRELADKLDEVCDRR
jgi:hypothetical protein